MHATPSHDAGRSVDWGKTSDDYSVFRPGPPQSFYARLAALDVGLKGQAILDLGTGTGVFARQFARQGAGVSGIDVSLKQIDTARQLAQEEGLEIDFSVARAESLPWDRATFDVAMANQCWLYFDQEKVMCELRRVLKPGGLLVTSHFSWLPRMDSIARASESLVLEFNPDWSAADWAGVIPSFPEWAKPHFDVRAMFYYDEPIPFTRETWRGRIRACRGVGATLNPEEIGRFDEAHEALLWRIAPDEFTILHRLDAHFFAFKQGDEA